MTKIEILNCRYCGEKPVWMILPMGAGIGCGRSANGPCGDNMVRGSNIADAAAKWNSKQTDDSSLEGSE